jgi:Predicted exonuclease
MSAKIGFWDVELTPLEVYSWSLWPDVIPITMIKERQHMLCFGWRWYGQKKVITKSVHHDGEEEMLKSLWNFLDEADAVVSWNGKGFDSKHARREFLEFGMNPPSPYKEIDLMLTAKSQFKMPSNKLDYWSQTLGIGKKKETGGFQLWLDCMAGDDAAWRRMLTYQRQDVNLLVDLYERMKPWIAASPNIALLSGVEGGCTNCGSTDFQWRGFAHTGVSTYRRFQCNVCGKWGRSDKREKSTPRTMRTAT